MLASDNVHVRFLVIKHVMMLHLSKMVRYLYKMILIIQNLQLCRAYYLSCIKKLRMTYYQLRRVWYLLHSNYSLATSLQWRHNGREGVSNHQRLDCLLNRLFRRRSKKTSKLHVTGLSEGNPPVTGGFPHKGRVARKMFSFDDAMFPVQEILSPT